MTKNAADLLLEFFASGDKSDFRFRPIWTALVEIEEVVEAWRALGHDVSAFDDALPKWKSQVQRSTNPSFEFENWASMELSGGDIGVLKWVARDLRALTPEVPVAQHDAVRSLLAETRRTLVSDNSLPDDLRLHIARLIMHVEECVDHWAVTGDFALTDALDRLFGAIRIAESTSRVPSAWSDVWEKWGKPIAVGFIVNAPAVAMSFAQILAIGQ